MSQNSVFDQMLSSPGDDENEFVWVNDDEFAKKWPMLHQVLWAKSAYGKPREAGRLNVFCDEGKIKVCIACPTEGQVAFATIESLDSLFVKLEFMLQQGRLDWRADKKHRKGWKAG